ncbi:MAG: DUF5682 family protein [Eubacteriales bacterium]
MPKFLGVRHLSPNGAFHIVQELERLQPKVVLIEGPSDFTEFMPELSHKDIKPPFAILAYTKEKPIKTIVLPMAIYSPEYQAILWCLEHKIECKFIDLPSGLFVALEETLLQKEREEQEVNEEVVEEREESVQVRSIYQMLDEQFGSYETFWESAIEHSAINYFEAVNQYGAGLREFDQKSQYDYAMNYIRESYMKKKIEDTIASGIEQEDVVVITGSFHVEGLKESGEPAIITPMTEKELESLPVIVTHKTLMPYSYFKLSKQAGYGAGNYAPNYYHMLWEEINHGRIEQVGIEYLTSIARAMREAGHNASSAQIIDAMNLANSLATLCGRPYPVLADLQDASMTCFGEGELGSVAYAKTLVEIGTTIGYLPDGMSNTSIQQDFQNHTKELKLDSYITVTNNELSLDLRENIHVKTEKSAFLDLNRSFFLHRLQVLGIHFCSILRQNQDNATFREKWNVQWSTEVEMELVESSLLGDTIEEATIQYMKNNIENNPSISTITYEILNSFLCGLPQALEEFIVVFQMETIDSTDFLGFSKCISHLMTIINYGSLRRMDTDSIRQILENLYNKVVLMVEENMDCDDGQVKESMYAIDIIDSLTVELEEIDDTSWLAILDSLTDNLTINQFLSGYATALLVEKGYYTPAHVENKIIFHLSSSMEGSITANWLEGLCMKNRYQLILNLNIWKYFDEYIERLDWEEFKRIVLFLRRAFTKFSSNEKDSIVDNLRELWGITIGNSSINTEISSETLEQLATMDEEFDFDDI